MHIKLLGNSSSERSGNALSSPIGGVTAYRTWGRMKVGYDVEINPTRNKLAFQGAHLVQHRLNNEKM